MTTKDERVAALQRARDFILRITRTRGIPSEVRSEAFQRLKHYPSDFDLGQMLDDDYRRFIK